MATFQMSLWASFWAEIGAVFQDKKFSLNRHPAPRTCRGRRGRRGRRRQVVAGAEPAAVNVPQHREEDGVVGLVGLVQRGVLPEQHFHYFAAAAALAIRR